MPGPGEQMAQFGSRAGIQLGKNLEEFINIALRDFTHMTVLLYMVREAREGCTAGDIAGVTSDPKSVIQAVLDRFVQLQLIRELGGFFSKKYIYQREGPRAQLVVNLVKLWEHRGAHEEILRRVLAPKK